MLCADGLATSRSTLHFLTVAHSRAKHIFVPSECGPGAYKRSTRDLGALSPKPNPNNTTLMCIEKPDAEVRYVYLICDARAEARPCLPIRLYLLLNILINARPFSFTQCVQRTFFLSLRRAWY